jgi:MFS family permease
VTGYCGNVWRLFVAQALFMFILWAPIWVVFLQGKGLSLTQIGVLEAFAWLITAAFEVPTGAIADRWGRKSSIDMGSTFYALAMFLILAEALSPAFLLGYALWNSSFAFMSGADAALLYDSLKADGRESEAARQTVTSRFRDLDVVFANGVRVEGAFDRKGCHGGGGLSGEGPPMR